MNFFKDFYKLKYYIIAIVVAIGVYVWAGFTGVRIWGDDLDSKEVRGAAGSGGRRGVGAHGFYHK